MQIPFETTKVTVKDGLWPVREQAMSWIDPILKSGPDKTRFEKAVTCAMIEDILSRTPDEELSDIDREE